MTNNYFGAELNLKDIVTLHGYQRASVDALIDYWANGGGHGLIVLPTGAGKSFVAAALIKRLNTEFGARILLASHVSELITQNAKALVKLWPDAPYGVYHAALGKRDANAPICFAGIHSIFRKPEILGERHVFLIDEAHLLSHRDEGMYRAVIKHFEATVPGMRVGGLTATPYRLSSGRLDEDYGNHKALFSDVVYETSIVELIKKGFLSPILPYVSPQRIDMSGVKKSAGDYNQKEMQQKVDHDDLNNRVVSEIIKAGESRTTWLVFASGVSHAEHLKDIFREREISCEIITGDTSEEDRKKIFKAMRRYELRCLVGVNALTTGLDIPNIDMIAMVRPTQSKGLWTQMLGRGTRLADGKDDCLLLDFTNNSLVHGPVDLITGEKVKGQAGECPVRECPSCNYVHHISLKSCPACHHEYPPNEPGYGATSRTAAILSTQNEPIYYNVDIMRLRRHSKPGSNDSLRIDYICGLRMVSHWVTLEHETAHGWAKKWWERNSYSGAAPATVTEALERAADIRTPGRVCVVREGKYDRISNWDYSVPPGKVVAVEVDISRPREFTRY